MIPVMRIASSLNSAPAYIVTHGPDANTGNATPRVMDVGGSMTWEFDKYIPAISRSLGGCGHAAWNITGDKILCSEQEGDKDIDGQKQRMVYAFEYNNSSSSFAITSNNPHGTLFDPMLPEEIASKFNIKNLFFTESLFPFREDGVYYNHPVCRKYTYKYAEWCGDNDYVILTLFCEDEEFAKMEDYEKQKIFSSRIVLVRISTGEYWDVTESIEDKFYSLESHHRNLFSKIHGVFSTCSNINSDITYEIVMQEQESVANRIKSYKSYEQIK